MLVDVVLLRDNGLWLRPSELKPPMRGLLLFHPNDGRGMALKRPFTQAELVNPVGGAGIHRSLLPTLSDAVVLDIHDGVITIKGDEADIFKVEQHPRRRDHPQVWRCTVVHPPISP